MSTSLRRPTPGPGTRRPRRAHAGYGAALAVGEFRVVLTAWTVSMLGNVVSHVALAVLVLERTGSPLLSALTFTLGFVPYAVGGSLFSAVADRYPSRRVLVAADLLQAALVVGMLLPGMPVWALLVLVAATGVVAPVYSGTRSATLPEIVSAEVFPLARALMRMVSMSAQIVGYALGGLLLVLLAPRELLAVNAASFVASAVLLRVGTRSRPARRPVGSTGASGSSSGRSLVGDSWSGVRAALASPRLRPLLLLSWLPPMFTVIPEGLAAAYVVSIGAPAWGLGLLLGGAAVGSVAGSLVIGTLASPRTRERLVWPLALLSVLPLVGYLAHPSLTVATGLAVLLGVGMEFELGLDQWLLAALREDERGSVLAVNTSGLMLTQGIGFAAGGALAEWLPITVVVAGSGVVGVAVVAALARGVKHGA